MIISVREGRFCRVIIRQSSVSDSERPPTGRCRRGFSCSQSLRYTSVTNQSFCRLLPVFWSSGGAVSWNYTSTLDLQHRPADKSYYVSAVTDGLARWLASRALCYRPIETHTVINCVDKLVGRMLIVASIVNLIQQTTVYCITVSVHLCQAVFTGAVAKFFKSRACGDYSGLTRLWPCHLTFNLGVNACL